MSTQSDYRVNVILQGDVNFNLEYEGVSNTQSPAIVSVVELTNGDNEITIPDPGDSYVVVGVVIQPPSTFSGTLDLKGTTTDSGVGLSTTSPTVLGLASSVTSFFLTASTTNSGLRLAFF